MVVVGLLAVLAAGLGIGVRATHGGHAAVDEPQYLLSALSLWEDHDLDISDELADRRFLAFHDADLPVQTAVRPDGRQLSARTTRCCRCCWPCRWASAAGSAAKLTLAAAGRRPGRAAALGRRTPVRGAARGSRCPGSRWRRGTAPLAVYGQQVYPELPGALAALVAVAALTAPRPTPRTLSVLALAIVALPWLSVKYAPVAAALYLVAAVRPVAGAPAPGRRRPHRRARRRRRRLPGRAQGDLRRHHRVRQRRPLPGLRRVRRGRLPPGLPGPQHPAARPAGRPRLRHRAPGSRPGSWSSRPLVALLVARPRHWPALAVPLLAGWATATWVALTMHGLLVARPAAGRRAAAGRAGGPGLAGPGPPGRRWSRRPCSPSPGSATTPRCSSPATCPTRPGCSRRTTWPCTGRPRLLLPDDRDLDHRRPGPVRGLGGGLPRSQRCSRCVPPAVPVERQRHPERHAEQVRGQHVVEQPGRDDQAVAQQQAVRDARAGSPRRGG